MNQLIAIPSTALARTPPPTTRFDPISIGLHWVTVVLIATLFASAWSLALAADGAAAAGLLTLHRSFGLALWLVAICRLGWRLGFAVRPPLPATLRPVQRQAAAATEGGLYALLLPHRAARRLQPGGVDGGRLALLGGVGHRTRRPEAIPPGLRRTRRQLGLESGADRP